MTVDRIIRQHLEGLKLAGLTHLPRQPRERPAAASTSVVEPSSVETTVPHSPPKPVAQPSLLDEDPVPDTTPAKPSQRTEPSTTPLDERINQLQVLAKTVAGCTRCAELAETRTQTVFGVGRADASILFIGEAPGADEDRQGEPFVGRAGQLMTKIIEACQWKREDVYICNILKCRPPGNRNPSDTEAGHCREYLDGQISIVDPDYIVCWGSIAAKNLLDTKSPIGKMRQQFFSYGRAKVLCTYHPSYLLRNPPAKKDVWDDMKFLMQDMGIDTDAL